VAKIALGESRRDKKRLGGQNDRPTFGFLTDNNWKTGVTSSSPVKARIFKTLSNGI
jgi:hypothetical protein